MKSDLVTKRGSAASAPKYWTKVRKKFRYLNGDDPVGGIFNVENRKTYTISSAHDENLISKKQAIMMLEAQASTLYEHMSHII